MESFTILVTIHGLLRAFLKKDTEATTEMTKETSGNDTPRIRQILMLPNGKWKTWPVKKPEDLRIILVLVRDNHRHPHNYITYDKWHIEGEFLITYSPTGRRSAHKIPSDAKAIYEKRNEKDASR